MAEATRRLISARQVLLLGLLTLAAQGCVSPPLGDLPRAPEAEVVDVLDPDYMPFRVSPRNRYAVVMNGRRFAPPDKGPFIISEADDVLAGKSLEDPWVQGDMDQLTTLLLSKGYDVYQLDFGVVTLEALNKLFERLAFVANEDSQLFVAYSGEGDSVGLRTRAVTVQQRLVIPPGVTLEPKGLFHLFSAIKGQKALLINACEAGIFAEEAASWSQYSGVVVAACRRGFATTPHEPAGTTAIFAAFLEVYADDPVARKNLASVEIDRAGGLWTNLAHKWQHMWGGGLPVSYEPAVFVSGDFWF